MTTTVVVNGNTYTDDSNATTGMGNGGHRARLLPMISDTMVEISSIAERMVGTSTSSVTIGTGTKTFTLTETDKSFVVGQYVVAYETASPTTNYMTGRVTAWTSPTLTISVATGDTGGSGTISAWTIALSGKQGATGPTGPAGLDGTDGIDGTNKVSEGGIAAGTENAITVTCSPPAVNSRGQVISFKTGASSNTGATTLNADSIGAIAIQKNGAALVSGDLPASTRVTVVNDGTVYQLLSIAGAAVASATETTAGIVELATTAETATGTDATRAVTPAGLAGWTPALTIEASADNADLVAVYDSSASVMRKMTLASVAALGGGGGMSNPMTASGDMIIGGTSGAATRLPAPIKGRSLAAWKAGSVKWGNYHFTPNVPKRDFLTSNAFLSSTSAADNSWLSVCWSSELGLFCAVANSGTGNRVMTSPDGITWTSRTSAADNAWHSVCWSAELGLFCAVAASGTGNRVMTSPDGITWTSRTSAADNSWYSVCWSAELSLFCAVSETGTGNRVMTSPDGITWTSRTSAADNGWRAVCWSAELGLFCAVAYNSVMTSPDGITWTSGTSAAINDWHSVCWSAELGLFCAVAYSGTGNRVMTSSDGLTWTSRTSAADNSWLAVCWASSIGLFCAVSETGSGNRVMTSPDGVTWTTRTSAADNGWRAVCWSAELGLFCAVANSGTGNRAMTSKSSHSLTYR